MLDFLDGVHIVNSMNNDDTLIPSMEVVEFQELIESIFQCCQERMQYQSERFGLPDAELRCLLLFRFERYLTAKTIAQRLNVAKSRVTKIVTGLIHKELVTSVEDPADSRVKLLSLTQEGERLLADVVAFRFKAHSAVLEQFSEEQRDMLLNSLTMLKRHMKSVKEMMV